MTPIQMLSNLIISFAIACLGIWLVTFDSILAMTGGWILATFGILGVVQAIKWFISAWRGFQLQKRDPEFAAAIDRSLRQERLSEEDLSVLDSRIRQPKSFQTSGASWEQAQEDWKAELERLTKLYPKTKMGVISKMASEFIKKKHPQFDANNQ